ncbi:MAG: HigA family addiction module antitoxin [Bryobacteraceae bacterium]
MEVKSTHEPLTKESISSIVYRVTLQSTDVNMAEPQSGKPMHPGAYIKSKLPAGVSIKEAAKVLGVGRPALSNLLNGKADLSQEMALRVEKSFGIGKDTLLKMQSEFDQSMMRQREQQIAVRAYVPPFLLLKARDIEGWADRNLAARSLLPVFLRKLVHSTGRELSTIDFPGHDDAERKGWDGQINAGAATPWIPNGMSGWEFGCNEDAKRKADSDYSARLTAVPAEERKELTFVFVTPRAWPGKREWAKLKEATGEWKSVKAYDSSDLEQWLEQSIPGQAWFAEQIGLLTEGFRSLDDQWKRWASVTEPELPKSLFLPAITNHKGALKSWLQGDQTEPLIIGSDSKDEALAFICCLFDTDEFAAKGYRDRAIVFSTGEALRKLAASSSHFIAIVAADEVERELGGADKTTPAILVRPRNSVEVKPDIVLDLPGYEAFREALASVGVGNARIDALARESGYSPTILRRRLARLPALRSPAWGQDAKRTRKLVPMMLVGAWHAQSNADCEILSLLGGCAYPEIEDQIAELLRFDDPPVWSVGQYRGVTSKIDAFFAVSGAVTQKDLDDFFFVAELVLSERDPALDLPEDKRALAGWYGKTRDHSGALREGICETLVILAVHGNNLFRERLGIDVSHRVDTLIKQLLTPLIPERLLSQNGSLPRYAEAAPDEFLRILEDDLRTGEPQVYALLTPADGGVFGNCPRTGMLWALETLAWKPEQLVRVCAILAQLAERKIDDNWVSKPDNSLLSILRCWMPQTAAPVEDRKKALEVLAKRYPAQAWKVCREQFAVGSQVVHHNVRPQWRNDASGAGEPVNGRERYEFARKALDIALAWPSHDEETLGDLIANLQALPEEDHATVWNLVDQWAKEEVDEKRKGILRERIRRFAFTRRGKGIKSETKDRARQAYALLTPKDVVVRHHWLFAAGWVEESSEEIEEDALDWRKREERIRDLRIDALREIWKERGFEGIQTLLAMSGAARAIGWHLAEGVIEGSDMIAFIVNCLDVGDPGLAARNDELIGGIMNRLAAGDRTHTTHSLLAVLSNEKFIRLLRDSPFEGDTWRHLDSLAPEAAVSYWQEVHTGWMRKDSEVNEAVDRLLEARRPRAAFLCAHMVLDELETSRLKRLLLEIATSDFELAGTYQLDAYDISSALSILQKRTGVTEDEMARLEFMFIRALDHSEHGIPNLERQLAKSPSLYMQVLALTYKRNDQGEDPPEWVMRDREKREAAWSAAYALLERMKYTPGTDETGEINAEALKSWIVEVRALCSKHGRAAIGDHQIGKLMSALPVGDDGIWPCKAAREALEEIGSQEIAKGIAVGIYNSRGVHFRGEGGDQERAIAAKYRNWAKQLPEYPYLSRTLEQIASRYDRDAAQEDSNASVRKRLGL